LNVFLIEQRKSYCIKPLFLFILLVVCHRSPGYGISLVAETTSGCYISVDTAASHGKDENTSGLEDDGKKDLMPPEDIGEGIANVLLGEIAQSGVVDSTYQVRTLKILAPFNLFLSND
jgi:RNA 3'-terminal phosphate cyclase